MHADDIDETEEPKLCPVCGNPLVELFTLYDDAAPAMRVYCRECGKRQGVKPAIDLVEWSYLSALFSRLEKYLPRAQALRQQGKLPPSSVGAAQAGPLWDAFFLYCAAEPVEAGVLLDTLRNEWASGKDHLGKPPQNQRERRELAIVEAWLAAQQEGMSQEKYAEKVELTERHIRRLTRKWEGRGMV